MDDAGSARAADSVLGLIRLGDQITGLGIPACCPYRNPELEGGS